jgi:hypothetical protein
VANCSSNFFALFWLLLLLPALSSIERWPRWSFPSAILATASKNISSPPSPSYFYVLPYGGSTEIAHDLKSACDLKGGFIAMTVAYDISLATPDDIYGSRTAVAIFRCA